MAISGGAATGEMKRYQVVLGHRDDRENQVTVEVDLPRGCNMGQLIGAATRKLQEKGDWNHRSYISHDEIGKGRAD